MEDTEAEVKWKWFYFGPRDGVNMSLNPSGSIQRIKYKHLTIKLFAPLENWHSTHDDG